MQNEPLAKRPCVHCGLSPFSETPCWDAVPGTVDYTVRLVSSEDPSQVMEAPLNRLQYVIPHSVKRLRETDAKLPLGMTVPRSVAVTRMVAEMCQPDYSHLPLESGVDDVLDLADFLHAEDTEAAWQFLNGYIRHLGVSDALCFSRWPETVGALMDVCAKHPTPDLFGTDEEGFDRVLPRITEDTVDMPAAISHYCMEGELVRAGCTFLEAPLTHNPLVFLACSDKTCRRIGT